MPYVPLADQYANVACKDRLGHFFKSRCELWDNRGELNSRSAKADLEGILILVQEDMAEIESIHAAIRRELFVLSTQSHAMNFLELSDRHVLRCVRRHPVSYGVSKHLDVGIDCAVIGKTTTSGDDETPAAKRIKFGGRI